MTRRSRQGPQTAGGRLSAALWLWTPVLAYAAGIFVVSSMSQPPGLPQVAGDKSLHALAYAGLAVLLVRALSGGRWAGVTGSLAAAAALLATVYGVTDELHQAYVPGRESDARDVLADGVGAAVGAAACFAAARARRRGRAVRS